MLSLSVFAFQENAKKLPLSLFVYVALDGDGQLMAEVTHDRLSAVTGRSQSLGDFRLVFPKSLSKVRYNYLVSYAPGLDKIKDALMAALRLFRTKSKDSISDHYLGLTGKALPEGMSESRANLIVYQVSSSFLQVIVIVQLPNILDRRFMTKIMVVNFCVKTCLYFGLTNVTVNLSCFKQPLASSCLLIHSLISDARPPATRYYADAPSFSSATRTLGFDTPLTCDLCLQLEEPMLNSSALHQLANW